MYCLYHEEGTNHQNDQNYMSSTQRKKQYQHQIDSRKEEAQSSLLCDRLLSQKIKQPLLLLLQHRAATGHHYLPVTSTSQMNLKADTAVMFNM